MNVLISGGAGFIGSRLARYLVERGHGVTVLDNLSPLVHGPVPERDSPTYRDVVTIARLIHGDVRDPRVWRLAIPGHDTIVHLAAETGTGASMYKVEEYVDCNVRGTATLLEHLAVPGCQVTKVVLASSRAVYGEGPYRSRELGVVYPSARQVADLRRGIFELRCPITGDAMEPIGSDGQPYYQPASIYGATKLAQENLIFSRCGGLGIASTALRFHNIYGPGQSVRNPYTGILAIFAAAIRSSVTIEVFEDGNMTRDFVYIDDAVDATCRAIESDALAAGALCVGSGTRTSVLDLLELFGAILGSEVKYAVSGRFRVGDTRHNFANGRHAEQTLGFAPRVGLRDGLQRFFKWVEEQPVEASRYSQSLAELDVAGILQ